MTVFAEANVDVDLRMLRSFRVLRPLKLVSRIPSKRQCVDYESPFEYDSNFSSHVPVNELYSIHCSIKVTFFLFTT